MARGLPHRSLRRLPHRSPRPSRRDHRNRWRILSSQRSNRTLRKTRTSTPWSKTMIANQPEPTPGLPLTINFKIPAYWTPEQALAVFELLDDLRDQIGAHYSVQRQKPVQADRAPSRLHALGKSEPRQTPTHALRRRLLGQKIEQPFLFTRCHQSTLDENQTWRF